jgi:peptidoglycan hydrolase-like protein with peptidoglycan-binding domain
MSIGSTDTIKNATPSPSNTGAASPKLVKDFNEAVDRSTPSNNSSQPSQSQGASTSAPIMLARRPPILAQTNQQACASPTAQQKAGAFVDPALRDVASGKKEIAKGAKGTDVGKMQEALQTAGYKLPKYGADGKFGDETVKALKKFQTDHCLKDTGRLDKQTMEQLSIASTKFPEYGKLFADGKLNTTIGVGFDEGNSHKDQTKEVIEGLSKRGYTELDPNTAATDKAMGERFKAAGIDPAAAKADGVQYFTKTFKHDGKDVTSVVKLITPDTPQAKDQFAKAMRESEMVIYSGHGRYGSGPDFDPITSAKGNFVIGKPYEAGHVALNKGPTDLQKTAMTKDYQLMLFDGCTTNYYLDDLRRVPGKDSKNLDLVVSTGTLSWSTGTTDVMRMLDGVTAGDSINQIKSDLEDINRKPGSKAQLWKTDGFNDN